MRLRNEASNSGRGTSGEDAAHDQRGVLPGTRVTGGRLWWVVTTTDSDEDPEMEEWVDDGRQLSQLSYVNWDILRGKIRAISSVPYY